MTVSSSLEGPPLSFAPLVDHTILRPDATVQELTQACVDANRFGFAGVCVALPHFLTVAREAVKLGAQELDVVLRIPTGFGAGRATVEVVGSGTGVKASGGIRAGANRIGTSAGPSMMSGEEMLRGGNF